jgi:hypothetical protein
VEMNGGLEMIRSALTTGQHVKMLLGLAMPVPQDTERARRIMEPDKGVLGSGSNELKEMDFEGGGGCGSFVHSI